MTQILGATRLFVDINAIKRNLNAIKDASGGAELIPMIKANAYGCGSDLVARAVGGEALYLAVADLREALSLVYCAAPEKILIIYQPLPEEVEAIVENGFVCAVCDICLLEKLNYYACKMNKTAKVHVEIDSGGCRLGVSLATVRAFFEVAVGLKNVDVDGIFMHYSCADGFSEADAEFTEHQTNVFEEAVQLAEMALGKRIPHRHACCGAAVFNRNANVFDAVRPGFMMYGFYPAHELRGAVELEPCCVLKTKILHINKVKSGIPVGYSRSFVTKRDSLLATVGIGYSDGLPRELSNRGHMEVGAVRVPIVGRVCMDLTILDITDVPGGANVGDDVTVFGGAVTVDEIAALCGTIGYEVITNVAACVPRVRAD